MSFLRDSETVTSPDAFAPTFQLDINRATAAQLQALPEIGSNLAARIVDYRELQGPFTSIDELLQIRGFGNSTLDLLDELLTVGDADESGAMVERTAALMPDD